MRIHDRQFAIGPRQAEVFTPQSESSPARMPARLLLPAWQNPLDALGALEEWRLLESFRQGDEPRWPAEVMPLRVVIQPHPAMAEAQTEILAAMRQWEGASLGLVRFVPVLGNPDILVTWVDAVVPGREYEVGHTDLQVQGKQTIAGATITLVMNPRIDASLSPERRKNRLIATVLHETGHALGLRHSERKEDIMHHRGWQRPYLSPHDIRRIQVLYRQAPIALG